MSNPKLHGFRLTIPIIFVGLVCLAWSQGQRVRVPNVISKVSSNVYMILGNGGNVAVMPTSDGVVVVDDMFEQDAREIVELVKTVTNQPIRYVLSTHEHGDHTGGNEFMKAQNAQVIMHKNARANMAGRKETGLSQLTFSDETQIFVGGREVRAKYAGNGHTNGDLVVFFPTERVLHAGDLFVTDGNIYIDTGNGGTIKEWDKTIERILQYDFDVVIPGHGPLAKKADVSKWVETLRALRARISNACKNGPVEDSGKRLNLDGLDLKSRWLVDSIPTICKQGLG
jgi:cyclase